MAYTLSPKPNPQALINWRVAPASLVGCCPLIQGEDPTTTLEYVTRLPGDATTFNAGATGQTTWQSYGVNMNGGGTTGARSVQVSETSFLAMDRHRRTIALAQRVLVQTPTLIMTNNESAGNPLSMFSIQAPEVAFPSNDVISLNLGQRISATEASPGADFLDGTAGSTLINEWHAIMVSWSDGTGADSATGMAIWDNGVLVSSKATEINSSSPGALPITLGVTIDAPTADFEYWYQFNEFIPSGNTLALKLYNNPYYFFGGGGSNKGLIL